MKKIFRSCILIFLILGMLLSDCSFSFAVSKDTEILLGYYVDVSDLDTNIQKYINSVYLSNDDNGWTLYLNNKKIGTKSGANVTFEYTPNSNTYYVFTFNTASGKASTYYKNTKEETVVSVFNFSIVDAVQTVEFLSTPSAEPVTKTAKKDANGVYDFGEYTFTYKEQEVGFSLKVNSLTNKVIITRNGKDYTYNVDAAGKVETVYCENLVPAQEIQMDYMASSLDKKTYSVAKSYGSDGKLYTTEQVDSALRNYSYTLVNNKTGLSTTVPLQSYITHWARKESDGTGVGDGTYNEYTERVQVVCQWGEDKCSGIRSSYTESGRPFAVYGTETAYSYVDSDVSLVLVNKYKNISWPESSWSSATSYAGATTGLDKTYGIVQYRKAPASWGSFSDWKEYSSTSARSCSNNNDCKYETRTAYAYQSKAWGNWSDYIYSSCTASDEAECRNALRYSSRTRSWGAWSGYTYTGTQSLSCSSVGSAVTSSGCERESATRYRMKLGTYSSWSSFSDWSSASCTSGSLMNCESRTRYAWRAMSSWSAWESATALCSALTASSGGAKGLTLATKECKSQTEYRRRTRTLTGYTYSNWKDFASKPSSYSSQCTSSSKQSSLCGTQYKSCAAAACGVSSYKSCETSACGVKAYKSCATSACGVKSTTYKSCAASACGVKSTTYKSCRTSACGVESVTYNTCANSACGYKSCNVKTTTTKNYATANLCSKNCSGTCSGRTCTVVSYSYKESSVCGNKSCATSACGVKSTTYKSCRNSACGVESTTYKTCRTSACGVESVTYNTCANSACGVKSYNTCVNSACGVSSYKTCRTSACGSENKTCTIYNCPTTATANYSSWSSWSDYSTTVCNSSNYVDCDSRTAYYKRTRSWNSWTDYVYSVSPVSAEIDYKSQSQTRYQTRTITWGDWSDYIYVSCTENAVSQCDSATRWRVRYLGDWSAWSSYSQDSCTSSDTKDCQSKTMYSKRSLGDWSSTLYGKSALTGMYSLTSCEDSVTKKCYSQKQMRTSSRTLGSYGSWISADSLESISYDSNYGYQYRYNNGTYTEDNEKGTSSTKGIGKMYVSSLGSDRKYVEIAVTKEKSYTVSSRMTVSEISSFTTQLGQDAASASSLNGYIASSSTKDASGNGVILMSYWNEYGGSNTAAGTAAVSRFLNEKRFIPYIFITRHYRATNAKFTINGYDGEAVTNSFYVNTKEEGDDSGIVMHPDKKLYCAVYPDDDVCKSYCELHPDDNECYCIAHPLSSRCTEEEPEEPDYCTLHPDEDICFCASYPMSKRCTASTLDTAVIYYDYKDPLENYTQYTIPSNWAGYAALVNEIKNSDLSEYKIQVTLTKEDLKSMREWISDNSDKVGTGEMIKAFSHIFTGNSDEIRNLLLGQ